MYALLWMILIVFCALLGVLKSLGLSFWYNTITISALCILGSYLFMLTIFLGFAPDHTWDKVHRLTELHTRYQETLITIHARAEMDIVGGGPISYLGRDASGTDNLKQLLGSDEYRHFTTQVLDMEFIFERLVKSLGGVKSWNEVLRDWLANRGNKYRVRMLTFLPATQY